jgi:hypothetical protein
MIGGLISCQLKQRDRCGEGADRIYPVNLPLRFNPWQDIGSTYGLTAEQKLERRILYHFGTIRFTATHYRTAEHGKVESGCGAVVLGRPCRLPPLSSGGALVGRP